MQQRGFTLIEISVVLAIIVIMSTVAYANFKGTSSRGEVINHAGKVLSALQTAQSNGISGRTVSGEIVHGWGLNLNRLTNKYTIFADYNDNGVYDYATKVLVHGNEVEQSGGVSDSYFTESSNDQRSVAIWNGAIRQSSGGKPVDNGYWHFVDTAYLAIPASSDFQLEAKSFSFDLWFKASGLTSDTRNLFYLGDSEAGPDHTSYRLYKDENNKIVFEFSGDDNNLYSVASPDAISADTWYNVAVARDDSALLLFLGADGDSQLGVVSSTPMVSTVNNLDWSSQEFKIANDGACPDNSCNWQGDIDELRLLVGSPRFTKKFFMATAAGKTDDEAFKTIKLPPGLVFERLYNNGIMTNELNLSWKIDEASHFTYVDNQSNASSSIVISHAGAEGTGTDHDTPATIDISSGGSFETRGF